MKYKLQLSGRFKKSYKKCMKRGYDKSLFEKVCLFLASPDSFYYLCPVLLRMAGNDSILSPTA